jgi:hypothetical protein
VAPRYKAAAKEGRDNEGKDAHGAVAEGTHRLDGAKMALAASQATATGRALFCHGGNLVTYLKNVKEDLWRPCQPQSSRT